jgi:hypothetical protein
MVISCNIIVAKEEKKGDFQVLKWLFHAIFSLKK